MKEALRLALEALERCVATCFDRYAHEQVMSRPEHFVNQAITAIKEALTQPDAFEQGRQEGMKQERALWVGLTDEEIKAMDASTTSNSSFYAGALWAEAKLKEKNTCQE